MANQTLTSGKRNEVVDLFIRQVDLPSGGRDDCMVQVEPVPRPPEFSMLNRAFDASQDQLTGRATRPSGSFVQPAMEVSRDVNASPNGV
jgi:hypothetical protein